MLHVGGDRRLRGSGRPRSHSVRRFDAGSSAVDAGRQRRLDEVGVVEAQYQQPQSRKSWVHGEHSDWVSSPGSNISAKAPSSSR